MSPKQLHLTEDDVAMCELMAVDLKARGYAVTTSNSYADTVQRLESGDIAPDVLVTDINLGDGNGLELLAQIKKLSANLPVVVITAFGSIESAVKAIRAGAYDFITKPFDFDVMGLTVERALHHRELALELERLRGKVAASERFGELVGHSPAMQRLFNLIARVAESEATILITGESGTGKELVARALHQRSRRAQGPFVALNCGALPEHLLESELFGHVRGAFTDAKTDRPGVFRQANGGTLFLDEVGELPLSLQPKLLRALQERKVRPVGADAEVAFDARIISATNVDLEDSLKTRRFREDLYYRLNVVRLALPPLRERGTDVLLLARDMLTQLKAVSTHPINDIDEDVSRRFMSYHWPGNVRELRNCIEHAMAIASSDSITMADLPDRLSELSNRGSARQMTPSGAELISLDEVEKRHIRQVLQAVDGNKRKAAQILGVDRTTLYRKLGQQADPGEKPE